MRLIQSYSTIPARHNLFYDDHIENDLFMMALSVFYANRSGQPITMHTDEIGHRLLDHIPYNDIIVDLIGSQFPHPGAFAYSKFVALSNEPLCTVHIDNDVFIKDVRCVEILNNIHNVDVIVQSKDDVYEKQLHINTRKIFADTLRSHNMYEDMTQHKCEYNTGVIGFNDQNLRDEFISNYLQMIDESRDIISDVNCPDIIFEQGQLYYLCNDKYPDIYNVHTVLQTDYNNYNERNAEANRIGYQHLMGGKKTSQNIIRQLLHQYDIYLYRSTVKKIEQIKDIINGI